MKKMLSILTIMLGLTLLSGTASAVPITWSVNGHTYDVIYSPTINWYDAYFYASAVGTDWHLATITSQDEQAFVSTLVRNLGTEFWLGGLQVPVGTASATDNWRWVTNEVWDYTHWNSGEPNDNYGTATEQWLAIWASGSWDYWNDESNLENISGYIIERSTSAPVPEPATLILLGSGLLGLAGFRKKFRK